MASYSSSAWKLQPEASHDEVDSWFDEDGRLVRVAEMRKALFRVGVDPSCRRRLWKYLFGIYEPSFTHREQGIVDLEDRVQYDALRCRWKALNDTIALTKDDLYSSPPYMAESDEEAGSEGTPSLSRTSSQLSQLSGKKSLSDGPMDDGSCILPPPDPPQGPTKPTQITNGDHSDAGYSKLNGPTERTQANTGSDKTSLVDPLDRALVNNEPFIRSKDVCSNGRHGDDPLGLGVDKNSNSDVIGNAKNSNGDVAWNGNEDSANGRIGDPQHSTKSRVPGAVGDDVDGGNGPKSNGVIARSDCAECCDVKRRRSEDGVVVGEGVGLGLGLVEALEVAARVFAARHRVDKLASYSQSRRTILRDVARTDRHNHYFSHKRNLRKVHRILMIYALFHPEVGYCQGMNDILAVFLLVTRSEVDAYWMFCTYMKDKQLDEDPTLKKIEVVKRLLGEEDREMASFLESSECCEMLFCHKWLLVDFKREFEMEDAIHMYEVVRCHNLETSTLTGKVEGTSHFQLCVCAAILVLHKDLICAKKDAVSIYSTINQLAMHMNLADVLTKAEIIFNKHSKKVFEFS
ncbi:hypothetical protein EMCRGX_G030041 [Ephydatia muelleri]